MENLFDVPIQMEEKYPFSRKGMKYHTRKKQQDKNKNQTLLQVETNPTITEELKGISKDYIDMGDASYMCKTCKAMLWHAEATKGNTSTETGAYSLCCMNSKIELPNLHNPPQLLLKLYKGDDEQSKYFIQHIRKFNMMFSFTSMGGRVDNTYNKGGAPYIYRMHGQNYHAIGSLLPNCGEIPKFSQLYIYDTENEVENRIQAFSSKHLDDVKSDVLEMSTINQLKELLDDVNPLVKQFRMVRDRFSINASEEVTLKLLGQRQKDPRRYNLPTTSEVAAIIIGDITDSEHNRDIVLETQSKRLQRINELHPSYLALQYPLFFPYAEDGFRPEIPLRGVNDISKKGRTTLSLREFFTYRIQERSNEKSLLLRGRRLFQQFLVDAYTMVENQRLFYIRTNQKNLRIAPVQKLTNAQNEGVSNASLMGNRIVLPSSFTGGSRYMMQNYLDAMTLCRSFGYPDLFITMTCNPKWPEICRFLKDHELNSEDRPDILSRMFKIKLDHLIKTLREKKLLGRVNGVVYTIEFQKRGLPHAHICIFLHQDDKILNPEDIDKIISTEIPDENEDTELHKLVSDLMIHGPCRKDKPSSSCMKNNTCSKKFPREFTDKTYINKEGFAVYRRRDNGITIEKNGIILDNRHVVGYSPILLKRYQAHINVEWCNMIASIKYLFKYINKGPDRISAKFVTENKEKNDLDEIKNYYDCRYISACEASWRLFSFNVHYQYPHVERLPFHLEGKQPVMYEGDDVVEDVLSKSFVKNSKFLKWMECNKHDNFARNLLYVDFPSKFVWSAKNRNWTRRITECIALGRISYAPPKSGDAYYLRIMLNKIRGPTCYEDIRRVNGIVHGSYKEACYALGLLDDDKEYVESIIQTSLWASGSYCRSLFAMLITSDTLTRPDKVLEQTWVQLSDDILHIRRKELMSPGLTLSEHAIRNIALSKIETLLLQSGMSLKQIPNMPYPDQCYIDESCNMLIQEELEYDEEKLLKLKVEHEQLYNMMTGEQKNVHNTIIDAIDKNEGGVFFLYGYGGTGKTFVWKTLSTGIRSKRQIVLNTASSGIAALLLPGGRTAHSRFKIPIDLHEDSYCSITPDSDLAALLKKSKLIIWDEAPMMHRHCFEALDRTLKDILQNPNLPFGGKVIVFGGDFRQVLPVIQRGNRAEIVNASINHSKIWDNCTVLRLTENMRLKTTKNKEQNKETKNFADWILKIGEGTLGGENDGEVDIEFPYDVLIKSTGNHVRSIVSCIYPSIEKNKMQKGFYQDKAILVPTNEEVDLINDFALSQIREEEHTYYSSDTICESEITDAFETSLYSPEILNGFKVSGIPNHKLSLKKDVPVMLLRNIDQQNGLCNGTRLLIKRMGKNVIEAEIISGSHIGKKTYIPRMKLMPSDKRIPIRFNRRQFPLSISFAMTINKSQGQSLTTVGLFLRRPVFTHGQLYVAVSRVTTKKGLKVLICDNEGPSKNTTKNVVYQEVLQKI